MNKLKQRVMGAIMLAWVVNFTQTKVDDFQKLVNKSDVFDKTVCAFPTKNNRIAQIRNNLPLTKVEHATMIHYLIHGGKRLNCQ